MHRSSHVKPGKATDSARQTFEIIVMNTGATSPSIDKSSSADGTDIANALYPFLFRAAIIV